MSPPNVPPEAVTRFRHEVERLTAPARADDLRLALAVSGGPDSLALLALAAAFPGQVLALTVDHGLRPESADEARMVARICEALGVPHRTLAVPQLHGLKANVQAEARMARYAAMAQACKAAGTPWLLTAHHADDQAETLLMRLARGSGLSGLAGVRARRTMGDITILRPLLNWRKAELIALVEAVGWQWADDPSNRSPAYDRTAARALLASTPRLEAERIAATASHLAEAEAALQWTADQAWRSRAEITGDTLLLDTQDLPREIVRRLVLHAIRELDPAAAPDGPSVDRLIERLGQDRDSTLGNIRVRHGRKWRFGAAPPHKG